MKKSRILCGLLAAVLTMSSASALGACKNNPAVTEPSDTDQSGNQDPSGKNDIDLSNYEVYYFEADGFEDLLTLFESKRFTLSLASGNRAGTYSIDGEALTLTFGESETILATMANGMITFTYAGAEKRFIKKTSFTISFDSKGGSSVASVTVENGRLLKKPDDPELAGYTLIGWYTDEAYTTPFVFGSDVVTGDMTLYARWGQTFVGENEYTVTFNPGYDTTAPAAVTTIGGKVYSLPTLAAREGYTFAGWWVSTANKADELSYPYTDAVTLCENTTLFALWQETPADGKLLAPVVTVSDSAVKWDAVSGAVEYRLEVTGPDGETVVSKTMGGTTENLDFASLDAGDYKITVTAVGSNGTSDPAVRYYKNKALPRVSLFSVQENSILLFNRVAGATKYYITISCGEAEHDHNPFENGNSTNYNFVNCAMQKGGIRFTVTAAAEGYASSVSEEFVYDRSLAAVSDFRYDAESGVAYWNTVQNAVYYSVTVETADGANTFLTADNFVSLKTVSGAVTVRVTPVTAGYNSPDEATCSLNKAEAATPDGLKLVGSTLQWNAVAGAESYEVRIGTQVFTASGTSLELSDVLTLEQGAVYAVSLRAMGTKNSLWSDTLTVSCGTLSQTLNYAQGQVTWTPVIGAARYEVSVNDGLSTIVSDGSFSVALTLTQEGSNTVKVRYADANGTYSAWVSMTVTAYAITLDSRGGSAVSTVYAAVGDPVTLPAPEKTGYDFAGWYNTPAGPASNGARYTDVYFRSAGEVVLYAYWTPKSYDVTLDPDLEGKDPETLKVVYARSFTLPVPTGADESVVFGGWYSAKDGAGVRYTDENGQSLINWDVAMDGTILYANWIQVLTYEAREDGTYAVLGGEGIKYVTEVTIPATYNGQKVSVVEAYAFKNCSKLVSVSIPDTVKTIETGTAFYGCSKLENVNIYHVEGNNDAVYSSGGGALVWYDEASGRVELKFVPAAKTGHIDIPDGVTAIPLKLFLNSKISSVSIPASVTSIEKQAFYSCKSLTSVTFKAPADGETASPLTFAAQAFYSCTALKEITLPARMVDFQTGMFYSCTAIEKIHIEAGNTELASIDGVITNAAQDTILFCPAGRTGTYTIPAGITTIGENAFKDAKKLTELVLPDFVTTIGKYAFSNTGLTKITFRAGEGLSGNVTIGDYAFYSNSYLTEVVFEEGSQVAEIGTRAFGYCNKLTSIVIPKTVKTVGDYAFASCAKLANVEIAEGGQDQTFGSKVFADCVSLTSFHIPASVTELNLNVFDGCDSLSGVYVDANNPSYCDIDGVLFNKTQTELLFYPNVRSGDYIIPATVSKIGQSVFEGNKSLTKITIGANIIEVGNYAFKNCTALQEVVFEAGETELVLGTGIFSGCVKMESIALSSRVKSLPNSLFEFSSTDSSVLKEVVLPEGIESIGNRVFYNCVRLESVNIPSTVTEMGDYVFANCKSLQSIVIPGNVKTIGKNVLNGCASLENITLEEGVTSIGERAFSGTAITTFVFPSSLTDIGPYMFLGCSNLTGVTFPADFAPTEIPDGFFQATAITSITIPKSVTLIARQAFYNCSKLETVIFEEGGTEPLVISRSNMSGATSNQQNAFYGCTALKEIHLPARTTELYTGSFSGCSSLEVVTFGEGSQLKLIGKNAFQNCKALKSITIPAGVNNEAFPNDSKNAQPTGIGDTAFSGCTALETVIFEEPAAGAEASAEGLSLGVNAFNNCSSLTTITLPARLTDYKDKTGKTLSSFQANKQFVGCSSLTEINIAPDCAAYASVDGIVYSKDQTALLLCPAGKTGTVVIPNTVTSVADYAFSKSMITEVQFAPDGNAALTLGAYVFNYCESLQTVTMTDRYVMEDGTKKLLPITAGNYLFTRCSALESVSLPESLRTIGTYAFNYCQALTTVTFASNVTPFQDGKAGLTTLSDKMFYNCTELESFEVPATVTKLGADLFYYAKSLTSVTFAGTAVTEFGNNTFYGCESLTSFVIPSSVKKIGTKVFYNCKELTSVTLSKAMTAISLNCFDGCANLTEVKVETGSSKFVSVNGVLYGHTKNVPTSLVYYPIGKTATSFVIPDTVTKIEADAVKSQPYLQSVTLPAALTSIGANAFRYCSELTGIIIPKNVSTIGNYAFAECPKLETGVFETGSKLKTLPTYLFYKDAALTRVTLAGTPDKIDNYAFAYTGLETIEIPASVKTFGNSVFSSCKSLTNVLFAEDAKLTTIGSSVFQDCSALTALSLPVGVTAIGAYCFQRSGLTEFTVPSGVATLPNYIFMDCKDLTSISIPESVTSLGNSVFAGCSSLRSITLPSSITTIGSSVFKDCVLLDNVTLPDITAINASLFDGCTSLGAINIPSTVTAIGNYAFRNCTNLLEIRIPGTAKTIGTSAFAGCTSLVKVDLLIGVESIGVTAFDGCTALTAFDIPGTVTSIGDNAFGGCSNLTTITVASDSVDFVMVDSLLYNYDRSAIYFAPSNLSGDLVIPDTVTEIKAGAFSGTSISSAKLPDSITVIPDSLFENCEKLQSVILGNAVTSIGKNAFRNTALHDIKIGKDVTKVGDGAFENCKYLAQVTFEAGGDTVLSLGTGAFRNCVELAAVEIPFRVRNQSVSYSYLAGIGQSCFEGCVKLASVQFGRDESLIYSSSFSYRTLTIGQAAFRGCVELTAIDLPDYLGNYSYSVGGGEDASVNPIGAFAFADCVKLASVTFNVPATKTSFLMGGSATFDADTGAIKSGGGSAGAFMNCISLKQIELPAVTTQLADALFYGSGLESFTIGDVNAATEKLYIFGKATFAECKNLKNVTVNGRMTSLPKELFRGCTALESVVINSAADTMTSIGANAFDGCASLNQFTFQSTLKTIGEGAFAGCVSLANAALPAGVTGVGAGAFEGWTAAQTITVDLTAAPDGWDAAWAEGCNATVSWKAEDET